MKKYSFALIFSASVLSYQTVRAGCERNYYNNYHCEEKELSTTQIVTGSISGGGAVASGIKAIKSYSTGSKIDDKFTEIAFSQSEHRSQIASSEVVKSSEHFQDGDRIVMQYNLNEQKNRAHHIDLMESNASGLESQANFHMIQSMTATRAVYRTNSEGKQEYVGQEPDYMARAYHASEAINKRNQAASYRVEAETAKRGGPVPIYDFTKEIEVTSGTKNIAQNFIKSEFDDGGKVYRMTRLPRQHFEAMKKMYNKGHIAVAGVAVGAGIAINELINGSVANRIDSMGNNIKEALDNNDQVPNISAQNSNRRSNQMSQPRQNQNYNQTLQ